MCYSLHLVVVAEFLLCLVTADFVAQRTVSFETGRLSARVLPVGISPGPAALLRAHVLCVGSVTRSAASRIVYRPELWAPV